MTTIKKEHEASLNKFKMSYNYILMLVASQSKN